MDYNLHNGKRLEEHVEPLFRFMGYSTQFTTVLHTRAAHIIAEMDGVKGRHKVLIECANPINEPLGLYEVQKFCSRVAYAREDGKVQNGLLVSTTGFTPEAIAWCKKYCSFVDLKTYKQLMATSAKFGKMLRKFLK
ncbi:MAG: restriction endonuclease [Candidatus Bathyarchaeota archaeon]|nr:restriction endonuclease [Candidatus Bathyarchaeota archaeon]